MKLSPQLQNHGASAVAETSSLASRAPNETQPHSAAPVDTDPHLQRFEFARVRGAWVLLDLQTGAERTYGLCTKEQAIRRAASLLRGRPGPSILEIRSLKGKIQSQRVYEGTR